MAMSSRSTLEDEGCSANHCYTDQSDDVDAYNSMRTFSTVGFVVGGVGLATGLALLLTAPSPADAPSTAHVTPWVGWGSAGVAGKF
jgi:hypothetical protein